MNRSKFNTVKYNSRVSVVSATIAYHIALSDNPMTSIEINDAMTGMTLEDR